MKHFKAPFHISPLNSEARWNVIQFRAPGSSSACKSWLLQKVNCLIYIVLKSCESVQSLHCVSHDSQRHQGYKCIWGGCVFKHLCVCFLTCIVRWRHNKNEPKIIRREMTTNCRLHGRLNCVLPFLVKRDKTWRRSSFQHYENRYKWQLTKRGQKGVRMFCLWSHHPGQWLGLTQAGRLPERTIPGSYCIDRSSKLGCL